MSAFLTIVKLTFRNGMRSHLFQLLLLVLLLCVVAIPATISGDGTADGFIRVSLLYSLAAVSTVLALSSVWLGCFVMSQDIENYQLHMVVTKPVSRAKIWLAKWVGVNLINLLLLVVSSLAIYGLILYNFNRQEFSQDKFRKPRLWFGIGCCNLEMESSKDLKLAPGQSWNGELKWIFSVK